jgi:glycosyltransferase involved in cell wall biosynthesis
MKILFLTYHFPTPQEPGAGRPWETAQTLRKLGHEPIIITAGTHYMTGSDIRLNKKLLSYEEIGGFRVVKTFAGAGYRRSITRRVLNYLAFAVLALVAGLRERGIDAVLMATDPILIGPVGALLSAIGRRSLMLDERDLYPDTAVALGYMSPGLAVRMLDAWQNFLRRRAATILAATPGIKRILVAKGVSPEKVFVFPNVRSFSVTAAPSSNGIGAPASWDSKFVVLYIGKFGQANDMFTILRAAKLLAGQYRGIRFAFIGDGEKLSEYQSYVTNECLDNVQFLSALPWDATRKCLNAASIGIQAFVDNSFWRCALSTKIFDYMLAGKPIVFAGEGDTADVIDAASAGLVVNPEDHGALAEAVVKLYLDSAGRTRMGANGLRYIQTRFCAETLEKIMAAALSPVVRG